MIYQEEKLDAASKKHIKHWGIPELKKYPINDETHVLQAVRFFNKCEAKYKSSLAHNIIRRANELNMDTSNWEVLKPYLNKNKTVKENSVMRKSYFERLFQEEDDINMNDTSSMDTSTDVSDTMTDTSSSDMNMDMGTDNSTTPDDSMPTTTDTSMDTGTTDAAVGTDVNSTPAETTSVDNTTNTSASTTESYRNIMSVDIDMFLESLEEAENAETENTNTEENNNVDEEIGLDIEDDTNNTSDFENDNNNEDTQATDNTNTNDFDFDLDISNNNNDNEEIDLSNIEDDSQQTDTAVNNVNNSINNIKDNNMNFSSLSTEFNPNESDSNAHNDYNTKDVETLNKLIASENSAIDEYFDAAMESKNEVLSRLYADIGKEERFHSEQLLFAKSEITGEKYEPRDPEVRKEYEELLKLGMDEETAMSTAVDKMGIVYRHDVTPDAAEGLNSVIDTMKDDTTMLQQEAMIQDLVDLVYKAKAGRYKDGDLYNIVTRYNSDTGVIQEGVNDAGHLTKNQKEKWTPAFIIAKGFNALANLIANVIKKTSETFTKIRIKREDIINYIDKYGAGSLITGQNASMYWYNPQLPADQQFQGIKAYTMTLKLVYIFYNIMGDKDIKQLYTITGNKDNYDKFMQAIADEINKKHHFDVDKLACVSEKNKSSIQWNPKSAEAELDYISKNCKFSKSTIKMNHTPAETAAFISAIFGVDANEDFTNVNVASVVSNKTDTGANKTEYVSSNLANQLTYSLELLKLLTGAFIAFGFTIAGHSAEYQINSPLQSSTEDAHTHMDHLMAVQKKMYSIINNMQIAVTNDLNVILNFNKTAYEQLMEHDAKLSNVVSADAYAKKKNLIAAQQNLNAKEAAYNKAGWVGRTFGKAGKEYRQATKNFNQQSDITPDTYRRKK